jgi:hypothetical protein
MEMSGGAVVSINPMSKTANCAAHNGSIAGQHGPIDGMGGLSLSHIDSAWEFGLSMQILPLHFTNPGIYNGEGRVHDSYLGKPAIPVTAMVNYGRHREKSYGYFGANAGIVFSRGRVTENFSKIDYLSEFTVCYNNGLGYTFGVQSGYRWQIGAVDLGFQIQLRYTHLSLTHGTSPEKFAFTVISFPMQFCVGYRI